MATLTPQSISKAGIPDITSPLVAADSAGDSVSASSGIFILVANGDASSHTLTVARPSATANCGNLGELPVSDITLVVAAGDRDVAMHLENRQKGLVERVR